MSWYNPVLDRVQQMISCVDGLKEDVEECPELDELIVRGNQTVAYYRAAKSNGDIPWLPPFGYRSHMVGTRDEPMNVLDTWESLGVA